MQSVDKSSVKVDASLQLAQQLQMIALHSSQVAASHSQQILRFYPPMPAFFFCNKVEETHCTNKVSQRIYFDIAASFSIQMSVAVLWNECTPFHSILYL